MHARALVILVSLAACGGSGTHGPTGPSGAAASTTCYAGTGATTLTATGQVVDHFDTVARRSLDPAAGTIHEEVAVGGSQPGRFAVSMTVTGSTLTMKEDGGAFTGDGTLTGEPWRWTAWTTTSTMPDGMTVTSTDTVTADGLAADKTIVSGGQTVVTIHEQFTALPCAEFEARAAALVPPAPPEPAPTPEHAPEPAPAPPTP